MIDKHRDDEAAHREHVDPEERIRPMPFVSALIAFGLAVWGIVYLAMSGPLTPTIYGDHRTLADLRGQPAAAQAGAAVDGQAVYAANCVACHQATGAGLPGVFPPLVGSEWVMGEPAVVANILLHGITGQIEVAGTTYAGMMPPFAQLGDAELAAVASYIRSGWGNQAGALDAALVEQERDAARRDGPFAGGSDLEALMAELADAGDPGAAPSP